VTSSERDWGFDADSAAAYDKHWMKLSALKDALHLLTRIVLSQLPKDAHILCVGAGTGDDILGLAPHYPHWRFTAVDPSESMMELCQEKMRKQGLASRCSFHAGYLSSLSAVNQFDAATCLLVSHFIEDTEERRDLFKGMASRLVPGGMLVSADFSGDRTAPDFDSRLSLWLQMMRYANVSAREVEKMRTSLEDSVSVSAPGEVERLITSSGFSAPSLFFQATLVHAWYARRSPGNDVE